VPKEDGTEGFERDGDDGQDAGEVAEQVTDPVMGDSRRIFSTIADRTHGVSRTMGNANGQSVGAPRFRRYP
jgi:hypothetical protein